VAAKKNIGNKVTPEMPKSLKLILISILILFAAFIFISIFFIQSYKIPSTLMVPALMPGDKIIVNKIVYGPRIPFLSVHLPGLKKPSRGDVVVFISPADRSKAYIKDLLPVPGERLNIKDGNVYVNGKIMVDPRIARNYYYNQGDYSKSTKEIPFRKISISLWVTTAFLRWIAGSGVSLTRGTSWGRLFLSGGRLKDWE
jgi:signal peptidase I